MLPYCGKRPLSLVRCPEGPAKQCFFQKHTKKGMPAALKSVPVPEGDGEIADYLMVDSAAGLVAVAQIGGIEIHLWGSRAKTLEKPDRLVFDLDPDPSVDFDGVRDAARDVRKLLDTAGFETFPLVTGGKGIHVVAPLDASQDWETIKGFAKGVATKLAEQRAGPLRRHHVEGQAQGPHLHRLAAQRARLDGHRPLFAARQGGGERRRAGVVDGAVAHRGGQRLHHPRRAEAHQAQDRSVERLLRRPPEDLPRSPTLFRVTWPRTQGSHGAIERNA